jgi:hypothetical protein
MNKNILRFVDKDTAMSLIEEDPMTIEFVSHELRSDIEFVSHAYDQDARTMKFVAKATVIEFLEEIPLALE